MNFKMLVNSYEKICLSIDIFKNRIKNKFKIEYINLNVRISIA